jgi:uncharacterized protein (DUF302 family)
MIARRDFHMNLAALAAAAFVMNAPPARAADGAGIVITKSSYKMQETIDRITKDIAAKKIKLFDVIDQAKLAKEAGVDVKPSTLIIFGNPPLGTLFITARAEAGLDWPVRLLVFEDDKGQVWTAYSDFDWIARRHNITNRVPQFQKASEVIASIVSSSQK